MNTIEWIVAAFYPVILFLPFLLIIKYTREIVCCKRTGKTIDNGTILKLIAVSITFINGVFIFIMQYLF